MRYWISYDLGLRGNYDQLYAWFDKYSARECGDSVATFLSEKTREQLTKELSQIVDPDKNPRIYIITMKQGGKFIYGRRKPAPWTGYAQVLDSGEERDE
ncbi:MAG: CRISPR-associated endonuclease Cas2 [Candidatus Korobacteraceae bacterium]